MQQKFFEEIFGSPRLEMGAETFTLNTHKVVMTPIKDPETKLWWGFNLITAH